MKQEKMSFIDNAAYYIVCVATLGAVWIQRVIITKAIQKAFKA